MNDDDSMREKWLVPPALKHRLHERAAELRERSTASESLLWESLRNQKLDGRKFRRQVPIGGFIVDL